MTSQFKGNEPLMISQTFLSGQGGFQDQFRVWQKLYSFCGERHAFAGASEQFYAQLSFQSADLVADCRLSDPQDFWGSGEIQVFRHGNKAFKLYSIHTGLPAMNFYKKFL